MGPRRTPQGYAVGRGRAPKPRRCTPRHKAPPQGPSSRPHSAQSQFARARAVGLVTGPPRPQPPHPQPVGSGPRPHAPGTSARAWESAQARKPHTQASDAPCQALSCRPESTQSQITRARAEGLVTGPHRFTCRIHSQWVAGPGRTPQGWAVGRGRAPNPGRPTPRQQTTPPRAPSCGPHSAQSQLPRARAVGLVRAPRAHTARTHGQWVAGPGRTPQGRAVGCGRAPSPRCPTPRQKTPLPPGVVVPPAQCAKPARKSPGSGVGDGSTQPKPPHPQPLGSGSRLHAPRTGGGASESAQPWTLHTQGRDAPPGRPRSPPELAQSQLARARAVG